MLKRIFIDNFRNLSNFELKLENVVAFLGPNGSGSPRERCFKNWAFDWKKYTSLRAPKGAASRWVIGNVSEALKQERMTRNGQPALCFLIMVDGDNIGFSERRQSIVGDRHVLPERVGLAVPTWSIDTWVLWLSGTTSIVESQSHKPLGNRDRDDMKTRLKSAIGSWGRTGPDIPPSLASGYEEVARMTSR